MSKQLTTKKLNPGRTNKQLNPGRTNKQLNPGEAGHVPYVQGLRAYVHAKMTERVRGRNVMVPVPYPKGSAEAKYWSKGWTDARIAAGDKRQVKKPITTKPITTELTDANPFAHWDQ